jgi:hypothetical protein
MEKKSKMSPTKKEDVKIHPATRGISAPTNPGSQQKCGCIISEKDSSMTNERHRIAMTSGTQIIG